MPETTEEPLLGQAANETKSADVADKVIPDWYCIPDWTQNGGSDQQLKNIRDTAKHGVKWAWAGIIRNLVICIVFPFWSYSLAECQDQGVASTVGRDSLLMVPGFFIWMIPSVFLQWMCARSVVKHQFSTIAKVQGGNLSIPWEQKCNIFDIPGGTRVQMYIAVSVVVLIIVLLSVIIYDLLFHMGSCMSGLACLILGLLVVISVASLVLRRLSTFTKWFVGLNIFSFFARQMAYAWNAEVLGIVVKTALACDDKDQIQDIWSTVMEQSDMTRRLKTHFGLDLSHLNFAYFCGFVYGLTLLQPFYALLVSVDLSACCHCCFPSLCRFCRDILKKIGKWGVENEDNDDTESWTLLPKLPTEGQIGSEILKFQTFYEHSGTNHLQVLMILADLGCMDVVSDLHAPWLEARFKDLSKELGLAHGDDEKKKLSHAEDRWKKAYFAAFIDAVCGFLWACSVGFDVVGRSAFRSASGEWGTILVMLACIVAAVDLFEGSQRKRQVNMGCLFVVKFLYLVNAGSILVWKLFIQHTKFYDNWGYLAVPLIALTFSGYHLYCAYVTRKELDDSPESGREGSPDDETRQDVLEFIDFERQGQNKKLFENRFALKDHQMTYSVNGHIILNQVTEVRVPDKKTYVEIEGTNNEHWDLCECETKQLQVDFVQEVEIQELHEKIRKQADNEIEYMYLLVSQMQRVIMKFALVGLVQNAANANIQISLFAIFIRTDGSNSFNPFDGWWNCLPTGVNPQQWPLFFNIVMCLVGTILGVGEIVNLYQLFCNFADFAPDVRNLRGSKFCRRFILLVFHSYLPSGADYSPIQKLQKRIWRLCFRFLLYFLIFFGITWWSIGKFVAIFYCKDRLWNFGSGCVHLDDVLMRSN